MSIKTIFRLVVATLIGGLFLISCKNDQKNSDETVITQKITEHKSTINKDLLIGSWKDQSPSLLHFSINADGTAKSDNMETLLYQKWEVKNNQLYLTTESIGNGSSSMDTAVYEIQKLNKNQIILKQGEMIFEYKKG
jgi:hypothetical protein